VFAGLKLLLDTHIWIWLIQNPARLGNGTLRLLSDPNNELWLSPISTWEVLTLNYKGKILLPDNVAEWLKRATSGTQETPFTHEIVLAARQLEIHQDPADRFLVATAQVLDLTLVTADKALLVVRTIRTIGND
jgi:PIN domain nuclease of toxin-antitoxin system